MLIWAVWPSIGMFGKSDGSVSHVHLGTVQIKDPEKVGDWVNIRCEFLIRPRLWFSVAACGACFLKRTLISCSLPSLSGNTSYRAVARRIIENCFEIFVPQLPRKFHRMWRMGESYKSGAKHIFREDPLPKFARFVLNWAAVLLGLLRKSNAATPEQSYWIPFFFFITTFVSQVSNYK